MTMSLFCRCATSDLVGCLAVSSLISISCCVGFGSDVILRVWFWRVEFGLRSEVMWLWSAGASCPVFHLVGLFFALVSGLHRGSPRDHCVRPAACHPHPAGPLALLPADPQDRELHARFGDLPPLSSATALSPGFSLPCSSGCNTRPYLLTIKFEGLILYTFPF